ncbi:UNVERIFIED_CONTAM: hypothetical protein Slati_4416700 [Sesamum latifolium]|uniref:Uncharacterized protein n=1 Tax=Sesamum latifolium TaxID=2727402 RepID=A0AAW2SPM1_9LAMI
MDGDFFKSLAKKPATKFDSPSPGSQVHQHGRRPASKREGREKSEKKTRMKILPKSQGWTFKDRKPAWQKVNMVYTPLTVPITQALMAVEGKGLLSRPRSYKDGPRQPKSDKICRFHNDYGYTIEECRHLKNEIERLIQNEYYKSTSTGKKLEVLCHTKSTRRTKARRLRILALDHESKICPEPS